MVVQVVWLFVLWIFWLCWKFWRLVMVFVMNLVFLIRKLKMVGRWKLLINGFNWVIFGKLFVLNLLCQLNWGVIWNFILMIKVIIGCVGLLVVWLKVFFMIFLFWVIKLVLLIICVCGNWKWWNFLIFNGLMWGIIMGQCRIKCFWKILLKCFILMMNRFRGKSYGWCNNIFLFFVFCRI